MAVHLDDVQKIAGLARLHVDAAQAEMLVQQLNSILGHMDVLNRVDTSNVEPMSGGTLGHPGMRLRDDVVAPVPLTVPGSSLAAQSRDGFICVPRLSTHGDANGDGDMVEDAP